MISMIGYALPASTATLIAAEIPPGTTVIISNPSTSDTVWLGSSAGITAASGAFPMPAYGVVRIDNVIGGPVYAYTTATGATVGVLMANLA